MSQHELPFNFFEEPSDIRRALDYTFPTFPQTTSPPSLCALYDDLPDPLPTHQPSPAPTEPYEGSPPPSPIAPPAPGQEVRAGGCRHWCFTLNHYTDVEYVHLACVCDEAEAGICRYLVMGREVGERGTMHLQGYVELTERKRLVWLKQHITLRAHWEARKGPREAARDYCCKDGDWIEFGIWKEEERGRRRDVEVMVEQASQGTPFYDAAQDEPTTAQFPFAYTKLLEGHALAVTPAWRDVTVIVKIGPTGCGKTRSAYDTWPDLFAQDCSAGSEIWWDGYNGQTRLILDDFAGSISYRYLLRLLDGYPIRLKVKGAFTYGVWAEVIVTTNVEISAWYPRERDISPLLRRIAAVHRYTGTNEFVSEHFAPLFA